MGKLSVMFNCFYSPLPIFIRADRNGTFMKILWVTEFNTKHFFGHSLIFLSISLNSATATGGSEIQVTLNLSPDALKNFATRSPEEVAQSMFSEKKLDKQLLESLIEECHKQMKLR